MILATVLIPFVMALLAPTLVRVLGGKAWLMLIAAPLFGLCYFLTQFGVITSGQTLGESYAWLPGLGLNLSFYVDGLALLFIMLVLGVGSLIVAYASSYLQGNPLLGRFYMYLLAFMGSMLGVVLADNLIALFVFWELTSITSYLLIGYEHRRDAARKAALQALLVTGLGGLALMAGVVLIGIAGGTFELSELLAGGGIQDHPYYTAALLCLLAGCFTKSAQFPFHFWLPGAMQAPTPVSAYLHSSTMVKAGVYLLARTQPVMGGTELWVWLLAGFGGATALIAAYLGTRESYYKRLLAYSTVSSLGLMVLMIGIAGKLGVIAAGAYILAHACFKGALFLVAGIVDHEAGAKDVETLSGLRRVMPLTFIAAAVAALSMAGVPATFGFAAKEYMLKAGLHEHGQLMWLAVGAVGVSGLFMVLIAWMVGFKAFIGKEVVSPKKAHDPPLRMLAGPIVLSCATLVAGIAPVLFAKGLVSETSEAIAGQGREVSAAKLDLGYLLTPKDATAWTALSISIGAIVLGTLLYRFRAGWRRLTEPFAALNKVGPERGYQAVFNGTLAFAGGQTRVLQSGYLSVYIKLTVIFMLALVNYALLRDMTLDVLGLGEAASALDRIGFLEATMVALTIVSAVAAVLMRRRLACVAALGIAGYTIAVLFLLFGAPDIAMTQFAVETLMVIIFVLVVYHLPQFSSLSSRPTQIVDAGLSALFGITMGMLVLAAAASESTGALQPISWFFNEESVPTAQGGNLVNVILVDFRAMDTLGEVCVLGLAAIGVYTLLRLRPNTTASELDPESMDLGQEKTSMGKSASSAFINKSDRSASSAPDAAVPSESELQV